MKRSGTHRPGPSKKPKPKTAAEGAPFMRSYAITLFERGEGEAANWQLIADTLLKAGLDALDQVPAGDRRTLTLNRLHAASYDRLAGNAAPTLASTDTAAPSIPNVGPGPDLMPGSH